MGMLILQWESFHMYAYIKSSHYALKIYYNFSF